MIEFDSLEPAIDPKNKNGKISTMRYLLLTYYTKPSGKIDEVMTIATKIKRKDWQTTNVILDFKEQKVLLCSVSGITANRDWDTIVSYYYQYYAATIERLFQENGHSISIKLENN